MKKLLPLSLLILNFVFLSTAFAESFTFSCLGEKSNYLLLYKFDPEKKTVYFVSSMDMSSSEKERNEVKEFEKVIKWFDNKVHTFVEYDSSSSFRTFLLDKNVMLNTAHYTTGSFYDEKFSCLKE